MPTVIDIRQFTGRRRVAFMDDTPTATLMDRLLVAQDQPFKLAKRENLRPHKVLSATTPACK
jgi:hypothetical protein